MNTYTVWCENYPEDEAIKIDAYDPDMAAQDYVEKIEQRDTEYAVGSGKEELKVWVRDADGKVTTHSVHGEPVPTYYSTQLS